MAGKGKDRNPADQSEVLENLIELQKDQLSLDREKLELQKQHIQNQADIAKQSLYIQKELLQGAPIERRKDRAQVLQYGIAIFIVILLFCGFCLIQGYESFLRYFVGAITHLGTLGLGYYFGIRGRRTDNDNSYDEAEIIDD